MKFFYSIFLPIIGFGFKPQSGAAVLASLDDKVADADEKLRDFMAEIESMDTEETAADASQALSKSKMAGFVSGGHVLPASDQGIVQSRVFKVC